MQSEISGLGFSHGPEKSRPLMPEERSHPKVYNRDRVCKVTERDIPLLSSATSLVSVFPSGLCRWLLPPAVVNDPSLGNKGWGISLLSSRHLCSVMHFSVPGSTHKREQKHFFVGNVTVSRYLKNYNPKCHLLKPFASISPFRHRTIH